MIMAFGLGAVFIAGLSGCGQNSSNTGFTPEQIQQMKDPPKMTALQQQKQAAFFAGMAARQAAAKRGTQGTPGPPPPQ
jgi:hypothetical protein